MKRRSRPFEIFTLSFLDVISCAFGAVVLLVLLARTSEDVASSTEDLARDLLSRMTATEQSIQRASQDIKDQEALIAEKQQALAALAARSDSQKKKVAAARRAEDKTKDDIDGLELVEDALKRATIRPSSNTTKRDDEVGGIPVDSDYILFIVDTSGSMQTIWKRVSREMQNVLAIHPKVKGFQILNDNGIHLISAYNGRWIPDTANRRSNIFKAFRGWRSASNSSPVEGLRIALKRYAKPNISLSIYILGDDYTGATYTAVLDDLSRNNTNRSTGKLLARIHAIGFISVGVTNRFAILMREVTKQHGGTFIALPR